MTPQPPTTSAPLPRLSIGNRQLAIGNSPNRQLAIGNLLRSGFTLIELLVVIGIILLLIGLFYGGVKLVTAQAKERQTRTMLETCKTMFENYRQATHLSRTPAIPVSRAGVVWCNLSGPGSIPQQFWTLCQIDAPDANHIPNASLGSHTYNLPNPTTMDPALLDTICVMYTLESIPENKTIINNLPATEVLNVFFTSTMAPTANQQMSVALLLDAWGNPILFVPGGGFGYHAPNNNSGSFPYSVPGVVYLDGVNYGVVTSSGVVSTTTPLVNSNPPVYVSTYNAATPPAGMIIANQPFSVSPARMAILPTWRLRPTTTFIPLSDPPA